MNWVDEEKIAIFNKINELYFQKNFGTMSKADFELLLFSEYIEHYLKNDVDISDYRISKELGITQSRVRSLKEKKELKYPYKNFKWEEVIISSLRNAKYDEDSRKIKLIIQDINVQNELRHFLEENGWYDEYSLNRKMSVIPLPAFVEIFGNYEDFLNDETKDKINKKLESNSVGKDIKDFLKDFSKEGLKKFLMSASKESIKLVLSFLPMGNFTNPVVDFLFSVLK